MRPWLPSVLLVTLVTVSASGTTAAQEGLQAKVEIDGQTLQCKDFRNHTVRTIRMDDIGDVAQARIINRMPIITLNQSRLQTLPGKMQIFFFNHECAHHVMAHVFYPSPTSENEADCWSIKMGRDGNLFSRADVEAFAPHLAHSRGSPLGHLPGPDRARRLLACFDDPSDELVSPAGFTPTTPPVYARTLP
ncbi:MAG: hypothetical protein NW216_04090 [Hyphomicrobium sp.]|nr:hypothetical protein [Hyphomicrobium sp.]